MQWTRSDTLALANTNCTTCKGIGLRLARGGVMVPCLCVLRAIFRACYQRFRNCVAQDKAMNRVRLERCGMGRSRSILYGRKNEEFIADFYLLAKKTLDPVEWKLFTYHYLLGADWKLCCRRLKIDRGNFFHAVYRVEEKLGRAFRETEPYGLFPLDEYFNGSARPEPVQPSMGNPVAPMVMIAGRRMQKGRPVRVPLAAVSTAAALVAAFVAA